MALGGTSYAVTGEVASKSDGKTLCACVTPKYHTLNLTTKNAQCPKGARKISFAAEGPRGVAGVAGAAGAKGADGERGPAGAKGADGERGPAGPSVFGSPGGKGDKGDTGAQGLPGVSGGGAKLIDGNNATLGTVIASDRDSATVLTSTGYEIDIQFDGTFRAPQIYYTGAGCTGTAYLNDSQGGSGPFTKITGKHAVYSASMNTLMAPATVNAGTATGEALTASTIDNPAYGPSAGTRSGWKLTAVTHAAVGLPNTIATPLKLQ